jgi:hypothetical protein
MVGSIDPRREAHRRGHWRSDAAGVFGPRTAETILASGLVRPHRKAGHMTASDRIQKSAPRPLQAGAVHIWPPGQLRPGLVDEHQALRIEVELPFEPSLAPAQDVRPGLLACMGGFLWNGPPLITWS